MAPKGREIYRLFLKVGIICETLCEAGKLDRADKKEFSKLSGITYPSLKAAWSANRISDTLSAKIAEAAGFDPTDTAWIDPEISPEDREPGGSLPYVGRDTPERFRDKLRRAHDLPGGLSYRVADRRPFLTDSNMLTFGVSDSGQEIVPEASIPLFLKLVVEPGIAHNDIVFGFTRIRMRLILDQETNSQIDTPSRTIEISGAAMSSRGTSHNPEWFLTVDDGILDGEYVTTELAFAEMRGASLGETFSCEVSVRPADGSLQKQNGEKLSDKNKSRIVELMHAKRIENIPSAQDSQGWVSLGKQCLTVVKGQR